MNCASPLIENGHGVSVLLEDEWLLAAVDSAARRAGYDRWEPLGDFSAAITQYLRQDYPHGVIEVPKLERVVRATLRDIGYDEIALRFRAVNPFQNVSLASFLSTSRRRGRSAFFRRLGRRIDALHAARVQHFHFYDLESCASSLVEQDAWWSLALTRAHIVAAIRQRIGSLAWPSRMQCTIR